MTVTRCIRVHAKLLISEPPYSLLLANARSVYERYDFRIEEGSQEPLDLPLLKNPAIGKCDTPEGITEDQLELFQHLNDVAEGDIVAYFVNETSPPSSGCAVHPAHQPGLIVTKHAGQWTLAHEIGHVLGLRHEFTDRKRLMYEAPGDITTAKPILLLSETKKMAKHDCVRPCLG